MSGYTGRELGKAFNRRRFRRDGKVIIGLRRVEGEASGLSSGFRTGVALVGPHTLDFEQFRGGPYFGITVFRVSAIRLSDVVADDTSKRRPTPPESMRLVPLDEIYRCHSHVGEIELAIESASAEWVLPMLVANPDDD